MRPFQSQVEVQANGQLARDQALLWNRFIVPIRGYFRHQMRVTHVIKEGPDTISIVVQGKHLDELEKLSTPKLLDKRYKKFRQMGQFRELMIQD